MGNQEQAGRVSIVASMLTAQKEKKKGQNYFEGKADVNKNTVKEVDEIIELAVYNLDNINVLSTEKRDGISKNLERRMTERALEVKARRKSEMNNEDR